MKALVWLRRERLLSAVIAVAVAYAIAAVTLTGLNEGLAPDVTDYAETAKSLVQGNGYTVNRILIHSGLLQGIRHPLEMHGILRPLEIAPLFLIFGINGVMARVPSILYMAALAVVVFLVGRRLFGAAAGCLAAGWILTQAYAEFVAVLGGDDIGLAFLCTATLYCFLRALQEREARWFVITGIVAALATLEKLVAVFLPVTLVFVALYLRPKPWAERMRNAFLVAAPAVLAAGAYFIRNYSVHGGFGFRFSALEWLASKDQSAYFAYTPHKMSLFDVWSQMGFSSVVERILEQFGLLKTIVIIDPVILLGGLISLLYLLRRQTEFALIGLVYSVFSLVVVSITHHLELRYLFGSYPMYVIAVAGVAMMGFDALSRRIPTAARRYVLAGAAALAILFFVQRGARIAEMLAGINDAPSGKMQCPDAVEFVRSSTDAASPILTTNPWFVTWETGRPSIMAPTNGDAAIRVIVNHYKPDWAFVGVTTFGAANLASDLSRLSRTKQLIATLVYDGPQCDVYSLHR